MATKKKVPPPATTPQAREDQLISLAMRQAEEQLRKGTAPASVVCEFIKRGSTKEKLEREIMEKQKALMEAKTESIKSSKRVEELVQGAFDALRLYTGKGSDEELPVLPRAGKASDV